MALTKPYAMVLDTEDVRIVPGDETGQDTEEFILVGSRHIREMLPEKIMEICSPFHQRFRLSLRPVTIIRTASTG